MNFLGWSNLPKRVIKPFKLTLDCKECRYSRLNTNKVLVCTLLKYEFVKENNEAVYYDIDVETCRNDIELCGPDGEYFKIKK